MWSPVTLKQLSHVLCKHCDCVHPPRFTLHPWRPLALSRDKKGELHTSVLYIHIIPFFHLQHSAPSDHPPSSGWCGSEHRAGRPLITGLVIRSTSVGMDHWANGQSKHWTNVDKALYKCYLLPFMVKDCMLFSKALEEFLHFIYFIKTSLTVFNWPR